MLYKTIGIVLMTGLLSGCGNHTIYQRETTVHDDVIQMEESASVQTDKSDEKSAEDSEPESPTDEEQASEPNPVTNQEQTSEQDTDQASADGTFTGLNITFDFTRAGTPASNQIAIWVEDADENLVKTLYATNFTTYGGYAIREDALSHWVEASDLSSMDQSEIDAVSGATPDTGKIEFFWDGTDQNGNIVPLNTYIVKVEGTLYWSSNVLFEGTVDMNNQVGEIPVTEIYSETDETNKNMIQNVRMAFKE